MLGGADRYVALVQASAFVALAVGVIGVARGLGLSRREALLGALLVATLPVIALQASTAQNDLVVASFLVAAVALLLDATVIRSVVLPSAMKLLGEWNWYLPRWLDWLPRLEVEHRTAAPREVAQS